jgi:SOS-response transcriptional repressor LexA
VVARDPNAWQGINGEPLRRRRPDGERTRQAVLEFIRRYIRQHHCSPAVLEIADGVGLASTNAVCEVLHRLEKRGLIERQPKRARSIVIVGACPVCGCEIDKGIEGG